MKAFRIKLITGFLAGHNECPDCILLWLRERQVKAKKQKPRKNEPKHPTEYDEKGKQIAALDSLYQEKHPDCKCSTEFKAPDWKNLNTNCAFSSVIQLKCVRYGTPGGNVWKYEAIRTGGKRCIVVHKDKLEARRRAVLGEGQLTGDFPAPYGVEHLGTNTLNYSPKNPMLIVGANTFIRDKVPHGLIQEFDLYLFFMPNNENFWQVGCMALSRKGDGVRMLSYATHSNVQTALLESLYGIVGQFNGSNWRQKAFGKLDSATMLFNRWAANWVYRCPKIALKDVTHLEDHKAA